MNKNTIKPEMTVEAKDKEICTHNCSCKSGDDCHVSGVLNYMELHACKRSYHEDYPHENGEYVNQCYRCRNYFVGHKRRVCCKLCLPVVMEKVSNTGEFTITTVGKPELLKGGGDGNV